MGENRPHQPIGAAARGARATAPWGFPLLYLGWAYLFWLPIVGSGTSVWTFPNIVFLLVGGASPLLSGGLLLWLNQGRAGFADLRQRLIDRSRISGAWWLIILLFYPIFTLLVAGAALLVGLSNNPIMFIGPDRLLDPGAVVLLLAVALLFPAIEEVGLRGYWFDQLQSRWGALTSSLILGVFWALWHVPLVYMPGYYQGTTFQPELWWWLPGIVLTAIIGTWVYNNTARSVLAVIVFHFLGNLTGETMGFAAALHPYATVGTAVITLGLVLWFGPRSLRGWGVPRSLPHEKTTRPDV